MPEKANAEPTKEFFVNMITKDIQLDACILDLLDNCVDGANSHLVTNGRQGHRDYADYSASMIINEQSFTITDNCGGISIDEAKNYAFRFGRRSDAPSEASYSIGLYGIGMKRAMFKMGKTINIKSSTENEAFELTINVNAWLASPTWDFDLIPREPSEEFGTTISITDLQDEVKAEFADPIFINKLRRSIARDYSIFLQSGFSVNVNNDAVPPYEFILRESDQFVPVRQEYDDESGVHVEITAGMAGLPSDDSSAESPENSIPEVEYYGWFVICNDRVVIAADKSAATVWGDEDFPVWHPQYNGFMGITSFRSERADLLPWTTTKRDIDLNDATYRRAVRIMKEVTRQYITYTTQRKADLDAAKELERNTKAVPVLQIGPSIRMVLPRVTSRADVVNICFQKPKQRVLKAAEALGNRSMPYKQVGSEAFDYFYERKVEE